MLKDGQQSGMGKMETLYGSKHKQRNVLKEQWILNENDVLFSNDTGILGKRNSEFSQQEDFKLKNKATKAVFWEHEVLCRELRYKVKTR